MENHSSLSRNDKPIIVVESISEALTGLPSELRQDLLSLNFAFQEVPDKEKSYLLWKDNSLSVQVPSGKNLSVHFSATKYLRKFQPASDLLCRACGWHLGLRQLWDLTAGLGVDSMMLSRAGFKVTAFERNPYLAVILKNAERERVRETSEINHIDFVWADAEKVLTTALDKMSLLPEVIYYDPMYPPTKKTALPSKEIQILREINGTNEESRDILEKALSLGVRRVVVKRPHRAPPIIEKPLSQIEGKLLRFDIY